MDYIGRVMGVFVGYVAIVCVADNGLHEYCLRKSGSAEIYEIGKLLFADIARDFNLVMARISEEDRYIVCLGSYLDSSCNFFCEYPYLELRADHFGTDSHVIWIEEVKIGESDIIRLDSGCDARSGVKLPIERYEGIYSIAYLLASNGWLSDCIVIDSVGLEGTLFFSVESCDDIRGNFVVYYVPLNIYDNVIWIDMHSEHAGNTVGVKSYHLAIPVLINKSCKRCLPISSVQLRDGGEGSLFISPMHCDEYYRVEHSQSILFLRRCRVQYFEDLAGYLLVCRSDDAKFMVRIRRNSD